MDNIRESQFHEQDRQSIIVYVRQLKYVRQLRQYGHVQYVSQKMKYVVLYVDQADISLVTHQLDRLRYVKKWQLSERPSLLLSYEHEPSKGKHHGFRAVLGGEQSCASLEDNTGAEY